MMKNLLLLSILVGCCSTYCPNNTTPWPSWTTRPTSDPPQIDCGLPSIPSFLVISGQNARKGAWPWQVGLWDTSTFMCGGSLISPQFVVTAAHCILPNARYVVVLGDTKRNESEGSEQRIPAFKTIVHPDFNPSNFEADIAIIKLARPAMINDFVKPVCLPSSNDSSNNLWPGQRCYITGWGKIKQPGGTHNILQQAVLPIVGRNECLTKLLGNSSSSNSTSHGLTITDNMVCGGERGSIKSGCHGDSGGPYVCKRGDGRWVLQGAVSWGSPRCDTLHRYTVFARVAKFRNWIDQQLRYQ